MNFYLGNHYMIILREEHPDQFERHCKVDPFCRDEKIFGFVSGEGSNNIHYLYTGQSNYIMNANGGTIEKIHNHWKGEKAEPALKDGKIQVHKEDYYPIIEAHLSGQRMNKKTVDYLEAVKFAESEMERLLGLERFESDVIVHYLNDPQIDDDDAKCLLYDAGKHNGIEYLESILDYQGVSWSKENKRLINEVIKELETKS